MIELIELARLEEGRLARGMADVAPESRVLPSELGGGLIARGDPGTWCNVGVGMGLAGPTPISVVDELIEWFECKQIEPRVELCPFAHESLVSGLAQRGFVVRLFENVFFRELTSPATSLAAPSALPGDVSIEIIDPTDPVAVLEGAQVIAGGFAIGRPPTPGEIDLTMMCIRHSRTLTLAARREGRIIGAGSVEVFGESSALFGLSVALNARRQGVQQALIAARLRVAAERGARLSTISSRPGVATERNARRMGFEVGYTKALMVRPGEGLAPVAT